MKSFYKAICSFAILGQALLSQEVRIEQAPQKIDLPLKFASSVRISPVGDRVAFSGRGFNTLRVADIDGQNARLLCRHAGVGWGMQWSPDGKYIAVRANRAAPNKSKTVAIEVFDVSSGSEVAVTAFLSSRTRLTLPEWQGPSLLSFSSRQGLQVKAIEKSAGQARVVDVPHSEVQLQRWSGSALESVKGSHVEKKSPVTTERNVVNSSWSPDRMSSAVEFAGRPSLYIASSDGQNSLLLDANGESPSWMNNSYVVYMVTEDDGHRLLGGEVWIANINGSVKKNLTENFDEIALYPSAAADGTIVFATEGGKVFRMKVEVR